MQSKLTDILNTVNPYSIEQMQEELKREAEDRRRRLKDRVHKTPETV